MGSRSSKVDTPGVSACAEPVPAPVAEVDNPERTIRNRTWPVVGLADFTLQLTTTPELGAVHPPAAAPELGAVPCARVAGFMTLIEPVTAAARSLPMNTGAATAGEATTPRNATTPTASDRDLRATTASSSEFAEGTGTDRPVLS